MPRAVVTVAVCGEPVFGMWCDACSLPSAVGLVVLIQNSPRVWIGCADCGATL